MHSKLFKSKNDYFLIYSLVLQGFYDDILIKAISHNVGIVIRPIPTPNGVITARLQHSQKRSGQEGKRSQ